MNEQKAVASPISTVLGIQITPRSDQTKLKEVSTSQLTNTHRPLSREKLSPRDADGWFWRAKTAKSEQEALLYLCRVFLLNPRHPEARRRMYDHLRATLEKDPSLAYIDEEKHFYRVRTSSGQPLIVPKERTHHDAYPAAQEKDPLENAHSWFRLALFGLLFAGIGSLFLAPIALIAAMWAAHTQKLNRKHHRRAIVLVVGTIALWAAALFLTSLFLLHL